jgi:hypothetical protein
LRTQFIDGRILPPQHLQDIRPGIALLHDLKKSGEYLNFSIPPDKNFL